MQSAQDAAVGQRDPDRFALPIARTFSAREEQLVFAKEGDPFPSAFKFLEFSEECKESLLDLLMGVEDDIEREAIGQADGKAEHEFPFLGFVEFAAPKAAA